MVIIPADADILKRLAEEEAKKGHSIIPAIVSE